MAYPVRSKCRALWTPPAQDPQPETWGWCTDHYLVDARETGEQIDITQPPTPGELWWRFASSDQVMLIPELRGAIQRPRAHALDPETDTRPANSSWSTSPWASHAAWSSMVQEGLRRKVAMYAPTGEPVSDGYLITQDTWYAGGAFGLVYELMTPSGLDEDDNPVATGIEVSLGLQSGIEHYRISMPNPVRSDPNSSAWMITRCTTEGLSVEDLMHAPGRRPEKEGEPTFEWLRIIPAVGYLVIQHSRLGQAWLYTRDGGCWPRVGKIGVRVFGCRAWLLPQVIDFASSCSLAGPAASYRPEITLAGEGHVVGATYGTVVDGEEVPDCSYAAAVNVDGDRAQLVLNITNSGPQWTYGTDTGRARTPVIYNVQEVHRTVLGAGAAGDDVDLSADLEAVQITHDDSGRGAVCTLTLRNYRADAEEASGYAMEHLAGQLAGIGLVAVDLAHEYAGAAPDGSWVRAFTGYAELLEAYTDDAGFPRIELTLGDRSRLWGDGEGTMHDLPDVTSWDLREAVILLLTHHGVPEADILFPADYPETKLYRPIQYGTAASRHTPDTGIDQVIDDLCADLGMKWQILPDGTFRFRWTNRPVTADFTLDPDTTTPEDRIEADARHSIDFRDLVNEVEVRGRTRWGVETAAVVHHSASLSDDTSAAYLGRRRRMRISDPSNARPALRAQQELFKRLNLGRRFTWSTIGRDLWPGDVVQIDLAGLEIAEGTLAIILGKTSSLSRAQMRWRDEFACQVILGSVV